jgi:hypothetical protein
MAATDEGALPHTPAAKARNHARTPKGYSVKRDSATPWTRWRGHQITPKPLRRKAIGGARRSTLTRAK